MNLETVSRPLMFAAVLATATISRLLLILFFQADATDTPTYELLAANIMRGCGLSFSDPSSIECILTSGGYFPGYPAFLALIWMLFGKFNFPILVAQLAIYLLSLYWLLTALMRLLHSAKTVFATGMLLALSPLQLGWFRFVVTEPLAIAVATWFLAELIISIADRKLRKYHLAAALSVSVYIRPDTIVMSVGVLVVALCIYDFKASVKQILMVVLLTSMPVSIWLIRNVMAGHAPLSIASDAAPKAKGFHYWLDTWLVSEYERADSSFPVWRAEYSKIKLHDSKFILDSDLKKAQALVNELAALDGEQFPEHIDAQFQVLAQKNSAQNSYFARLKIYITRAFYLLFNPLSSWGLPLEIRNIDRNNISFAISRLNLKELDNILNDQKVEIIGKGVGFIYRAILFSSFFFIVINFVLKKREYKCPTNENIRILFLAAALFVFLRISFFIILGALESRYLVEFVPWVECCVAIWFLNKHLKVIIND